MKKALEEGLLAENEPGVRDNLKEALHFQANAAAEAEAKAAADQPTPEPEAKPEPSPAPAPATAKPPPACAGCGALAKPDGSKLGFCNGCTAPRNARPSTGRTAGTARAAPTSRSEL